MYLTASDGVRIAYDYYQTDQPKRYLLLIHMMPATKESWKNFAEQMQDAGFASLAIDLRGHGQSDGGPDGFQNFSDAEHQKSIADVEVALGFLKEQGASWESIALIGASIGANLALWAMANHAVIKKAALLSAGLDYRGIQAPPLIRRLSANQQLLLIAGKDDNDNAAMNETLSAHAPAGVTCNLMIVERGGHGTALLPQVTPVIRDFLLGQ